MNKSETTRRQALTGTAAAAAAVTLGSVPAGAQTLAATADSAPSGRLASPPSQPKPTEAGMPFVRAFSG